MENHNSNHHDESEISDPTWDLLKKARPVEPGPFFSRNVMREIRQLEEKDRAAAGWFSWLRNPAIALAGAAAVIALAAIVFSPNPESNNGSGVIAESQITEPDSPTAEFANVDYIGDLMAVADPSTLTDQAFAELF